MSMYFKTNSPAVMAAWAKDRDDRAALQAKIDAFASRFGGKGMMYSDPPRFAGIIFAQAKPRDLWRAPDRLSLQVPRSSPLKGASAETKAELKRLQAEWEEHRPTERLTDDGVYKALGFSSSMDFIWGGLTLFVYDGWLYAQSGTAMPQLTEIVGSEFEAARAGLRK